ncbi:hypothetical protein [Mumia sp. Pv 4-285]|uniref:hypothetical protein n=1 Tax=Mumia qirimensis TaxID=3234852 RepID=UPI00351D156F
MVSKRSVVLLAAGMVCGLLVGGTTAYAVSSAKTVKVCVTKAGVVRSANEKGKCPKRTKKRAVAVRGPVGQRGVRGPAGAAGTAMAWGSITVDGKVVPGSYRIKAVRQDNAAYQYCVQLSVALPESRLAAAQLRTTSGPGGFGHLEVGLPNCPAGWLDISTWRLSTGGFGASPEPFSILVP